jgi:hypothetical protein
MSPRQARRERREAERKARKAEIRRMKAARHMLPTTPSPEFSEANPLGFVMPPATPAELCEQNPDREGGVRDIAPPREFSAPNPSGFVSQSTSSRRAINRANAQYSTGPRSIAGKLASSRNSLQHGLASGTLIIPGEDPAAFDQLTAALLGEHRPTGDTETLLVHEMARSWWLTQRAIRLQNECFTEGGIDEKRLALLLRYQTTHERAFHKALDTLLKLKRSRDRQQAVPATPNAIGFVSHNTIPTVREGIGFVSPNNPSSAPEIGFVSQNPAVGSPNQPPIVAEAA